MSFLEAGLYISLAICLAGLGRRVRGWFKPWPDQDPSSLAKGGTLKFGGVARAVARDVLLLRRTGKRSLFRWSAHILALLGFTYLLVFHSLAGIVSENLFRNYFPTLDPWQTLRNLAGLMVLSGLLTASLRRLANKRIRNLSGFRDWFFLALLGAIIGSGFLLEATKIAAPSSFDRMVGDYLGSDDTAEVLALKTYWAREQGTIFTRPLPDDPKTLSLGAELAADNCMDCHADTRTAFVSFHLAGLLDRVVPLLAAPGIERSLYFCHVILCFLGLALLPWSKMAHSITTPLNLALQGGSRDSNPGTPFKAPWIRGLGLDACTRCVECDLHCSVRPAFTVLGNPDIRPSERLETLGRNRIGGLGQAEVRRMEQGGRICTECGRCTQICPAGIDLQEIWTASRPSETRLIMEMRESLSSVGAEEFRKVLKAGSSPARGLMGQPSAFQACIQCTTCTSVCPVVAISPNPAEELGFTPQQIMNLIRMGRTHLAAGTGMVWSCTTCYQCQEHCPKGIAVADILGELRSSAFSVYARLDQEVRA